MLCVGGQFGQADEGDDVDAVIASHRAHRCGREHLRPGLVRPEPGDVDRHREIARLERLGVSGREPRAARIVSLDLVHRRRPRDRYRLRHIAMRGEPPVVPQAALGGSRRPVEQLLDIACLLGQRAHEIGGVLRDRDERAGRGGGAQPGIGHLIIRAQRERDNTGVAVDAPPEFVHAIHGEQSRVAEHDEHPALRRLERLGGTLLAHVIPCLPRSLLFRFVDARKLLIERDRVVPVGHGTRPPLLEQRLLGNICALSDD